MLKSVRRKNNCILIWNQVLLFEFDAFFSGFAADKGLDARSYARFDYTGISVFVEVLSILNARALVSKPNIADSAVMVKCNAAERYVKCRVFQVDRPDTISSVATRDA